MSSTATIPTAGSSATEVKSLKINGKVFDMSDMMAKMKISPGSIIGESDVNLMVVGIIAIFDKTRSAAIRNVLQQKKRKIYEEAFDEFTQITEKLSEMSHTFTEDVKRMILQMKIVSKRSSSTLTVSEALTKMVVASSTMDVIRENAAHFVSFGSSTSHTLRENLFKLFKLENLDGESIFFVYFLTSLIKNKGRIESSMGRMPSSFQNLPSVSSARRFINNRVVQYVPEESAGNKFAIVHLPTTMPGLDILCNLLITPKNKRSLDILYERQTFAQISLEEFMIGKCKESQKIFWERKVMTTKNLNNTTFRPVFREEFFATSSSDQYKLVSSTRPGGSLRWRR